MKYHIMDNYIGAPFALKAMNKIVKKYNIHTFYA